MKKLIRAVIGMALFVAGYQHTRRQSEYITAQSALTNTPTYVVTPASTPASLKKLVAFQLIKSS